ncbi:unnamed protein product [Rotaria sordida]|nr:unnamed protein product [Rotaria sordida]
MLSQTILIDEINFKNQLLFYFHFFLFKHVGDLGNVQADENVIVMVNIKDELFSINDEHLGRGDSSESKKTGNVGKYSVCDIIDNINSEKINKSIEENLFLSYES